MQQLLVKLISFLTGQSFLPPAQVQAQRLELENLHAKQHALEKLASELRSELKRSEAQAQQTIDAIQTEHTLVLERKQAEIDRLSEGLQQLNRSVDIETQRQIRENSDLLNQLNWLSGTIAHDFRAPLRAIDAYSFFLRDDLGDNMPPEAGHSLEEIQRNGKRMGVLLDALIEYLRLGVCPLNVLAHDLNETIQQTIDAHFAGHAAKIEVQVQGQWRFDKPMMMRALQELIDNAVKFSEPVESPKIIVRQPSPGCIEIVDNGVGYSENHQGQKFQLFHRMHGNDEFKGEGIGLATAERITSRHHMALTLNRTGEHTVACIQLPENALA